MRKGELVLELNDRTEKLIELMEMESKLVKVLGYEFAPLTESDRMAFAGAEDDDLIAYADDNSTVLIYCPSEKKVHAYLMENGVACFQLWEKIHEETQ